jgi:hypothetical protein
MIKRLTLSKAKKKAWKVFSLWIRQRGAVGNTNKCVTCGTVRDIKKLQAGHWIPGHHNAVYFDERNVNVQCDYCNRILGSNGPKYYEFMLKTYGKKVMDELQYLETTTVKYTVEDYLEIESKYKKLLR